MINKNGTYSAKSTSTPPESFYLNNTSWRPDPCQECSCIGDVVICETRRCQSPQRDFLKAAEMLSHFNIFKQHGNRWTDSGYNVCMCSHGNVSCTKRRCPCGSGEMQGSTSTEDRCPGCIRSGASCFVGNQEYWDGGEWRPARCVRCVCNAGEAQCFIAECPPVSCKRVSSERLVMRAGECCPQCLPSTCQVDGREHKYTRGSEEIQIYISFVSSGLCPVPFQGQNRTFHVGQSCGEYMSPEGSCLHGTVVRYNGEVWSGVGCQSCTCKAGRVQSFLVASHVSECILCLASSPQNLDVWQEGPCRVCECLHSRVTCYRLACPPHPSGTLALPVEGSCCPECQIPCHLDCLSRSQNPSLCNRCKDPISVLHNGHHFECPPGFYQNGNTCAACKASCLTDQDECTLCGWFLLMRDRQCLMSFYLCPLFPECHSSCRTCWGPSVSHCSLCPGTMVLYYGQCLQTCGKGMFAHGSCHMSCLSCIGPESSDCLSCLFLGEVLQLSYAGETRGTCVSSCKDHFYSDPDCVCRRCHDSCLQCAGNSTLNCTACASPSVLHQGQCLCRCPQGYHRHGDASCHPTCKECSGSSETHCTDCSPDTVLENGSCKTRCPEEQYHSHTGHCVDCKMDCLRCVLDLQNEGSVCLLCRDPKSLTLGDHCVTHCPHGHYIQLGACKSKYQSTSRARYGLSLGAPRVPACKGAPIGTEGGGVGGPTDYCSLGASVHLNPPLVPWVDNHCFRDPIQVLLLGDCQHECCAPYSYLTSCDDHCEACRGPGQCSRCRKPRVLKHSVCVEEGQQHVISLNRSCGIRLLCSPTLFACPTGCTKCEGAGQCTACHRNTSLKDHLCVADCGPGFYANPRTQKCEVNTQAPVLRVHGDLIVPIGGTRALDLSLITAEDLENRREDLVFQLLRLPSNGQLARLTNGKAVPLNQGSVFSFSDLRNRAIAFSHDRGNSRSGTLMLQVADPQLFSQPNSVHIQVVSLQPPCVFVNKPLMVKQGEAAVITRSVLWVADDDDDPEDVLLLVLDPAQHGHLTRVYDEKPVRHFTLGELGREQLRYIHGGSSQLQDRVLLQISDGHSYQNLLFTIDVENQGLVTSHVVSFLTAWVNEGGAVRITKRHLRAECHGSRDSQIHYTISPSKENPKYGEIVLWSSMSTSIHDEELLLSNNPAAIGVLSFAQADINRGRVWYRHLGSRVDWDAVKFQGSLKSIILGHTLRVGVLPHSPGFPILSLGCTLQITVPEDCATKILPSGLSFVVTEMPSENCIYNITIPLAQEQGTIEHKDKAYTPVYSFTQRDIDNGKILYRPPVLLPFMKRLYKCFFTGDYCPQSVYLNVPVSIGNHSTPEMDFAIDLLPSDQQPPEILDPVLEVLLGGRVALGKDLSLAFTSDAANSQLDLVEPPCHGILLWVTVFSCCFLCLTGNTLSVGDIKQHLIQYEHAGKSTEDDAMTFIVTHGSSLMITMVKVKVLVPGERGNRPSLKCDTVLSMEVSEKSSTPIRHTHLACTDCSSSNKKIKILMVSLPKHGVLTWKSSASDHKELKENSSFTTEDINHQRIWYIASECGNPPFTDTFLFIFCDENDNCHDNQTWSLTITTLPKLKFYSQPLENGSVLLQRSSFSYQDVLDKLLVYVPNNLTVGTDMVLLSVSDGQHIKTARLEFSIRATKNNDRTMIVNRGLQLTTGSKAKITDQHLRGSGSNLTYIMTKDPSFGMLHLSKNGNLTEISSKGPVKSFTQEDINKGSVEYVHGKEEEGGNFTFKFNLRDSEGKKLTEQSFLISVLGMYQFSFLSFKLHISDAFYNGKVDNFIIYYYYLLYYIILLYGIMVFPLHGFILFLHDYVSGTQINTFAPGSLTQYTHNSEEKEHADDSTFTLSDSFNEVRLLKNTWFFFGHKAAGRWMGHIVYLTASLYVFKIVAAVSKRSAVIALVKDGALRLVTNLGLQWLDYMDNKVNTVIISKEELLSVNPEVDERQVTYNVLIEPKHGVLTKYDNGMAINTFTQADINLGLIYYVLNVESVHKTLDSFSFSVNDNKGNVINGSEFRIEWSVVAFERASYSVSEDAGSVAVKVSRRGNLKQRASVTCQTGQGTATVGVTSSPGQQDYVEFAEQITFNHGEDSAVCTIVIKDDQVFENIESFYVELSRPVCVLLGETFQAVVHIVDMEDKPVVQFQKSVYHISEGAGFLSAPVERKGDTGIIVSALCHTMSGSSQESWTHAMEPGADFSSSGMPITNRIIFAVGVSESTCDVKLDAEYETFKEFELVLSEASDNAHLGQITTAKVVIDGRNEVPTVFLGNESFTYTEDAGTIEIPVLRRGSKLSSMASVWCVTRPSDPMSATPGVDYISSSKKVEFKPGEKEQTCSLAIKDDAHRPIIEGMESFVVFLSSPEGAMLTEPFEAAVIIVDTFQDIPSMQFEEAVYSVKETAHLLHLPVVRSGDLTFTSSVRCYTENLSASAAEDFGERRNGDESRITFLVGEKVKNCTIWIHDDSVFEPQEMFRVHLGGPEGGRSTGALVGMNRVVTVTITNDEDVPSIEFEDAKYEYQVQDPEGSEDTRVLGIKVIRRGDQNQTSAVRCSTRDGSAQSGVDYSPKSMVLQFNPGMDHIVFNIEILSSEDREWHKLFSVILGPDEPLKAVLGEITMATVTILHQQSSGNLILSAPPIVVSLSDYDHIQEVPREGPSKSPSSGYPLVCVIPCDPHHPNYSAMKESCREEGINHNSIHFGWEVAAPTDTSGTRSPFETVTDSTPYTSVNHMLLDSIYFSRRFRVRCVAQALDGASLLGPPRRSNTVTISSEGPICPTPGPAGGARGFQAQSFIATLKYLDVKHKEHPNRIHISVQIPHQDGMFPLVSTMPLNNLHLLLSESTYRQHHICSNLVTIKDLHGITESGFLDNVAFDTLSLSAGYDRPYQFNSSVREARTIQLYKHLNLKTCIWAFEAYYDMTELIDVCGGSVTADFQVRDSTQSFLTVRLPLYVSYIYVMTPRGWASLEHQKEMQSSFFYDTMLWRTGIQTDSVLSAKLHISKIYIIDVGRLVIEFKTQTKFRGQFVLEHHTLKGQRSHVMAPDHLGGVDFDLQLLWSSQSFDSAHQLWRATSSYSRKDYSGEYTIFLIPCTVKLTQSWTDPGDKPLSCTAQAPEKFLVPIAFQQTNRPVPIAYSLNTEFHLCNTEKVFMMDPAAADLSVAEMDYKGTFSMGQTLYGRVLWKPEQSLNTAYKLQLEKVYLCTGRNGYVPFFDPTGTLYNEGPQYGCIQPNKHLKHRFLLLDRKQPEVCDRYFHDVPFNAKFASESADLQPMTMMSGVDGFTMKVDALYKVETGHQWYLQVIYVIRPQAASGPRIQRSLTKHLKQLPSDLVDETIHRFTMDESLVYDNVGDHIKNGTNMKALRLDREVPTFYPQTGASIGGGVVAIILVALVLLTVCILFKKHRWSSEKSTRYVSEEYPLNTKVEVCLEKTFHSMHCTVRKVNVVNVTQEASNLKVKQVNLEVKLHGNLDDGTEV
uniref:Fraser extracellular matrix complex subunit 1 n=1 Tax=Paramormyrops kingsleyae TaxID=1676925 RepID=A0A3B3RJD3_9TELE